MNKISEILKIVNLVNNKKILDFCLLLLLNTYTIVSYAQTLRLNVEDTDFEHGIVTTKKGTVYTGEVISKTGNQTAIRTVKDGKIVSEKAYYENRLISEIIFLSFPIPKEQKTYFSNGNIKTHYYMPDNEKFKNYYTLVGDMFYLNGQIASHGSVQTDEKRTFVLLEVFNKQNKKIMEVETDKKIGYCFLSNGNKQLASKEQLDKYDQEVLDITRHLEQDKELNFECR